MTRLEYELLRDKRPDLGLPSWTLMWGAQLYRIQALSEIDLVAQLTARRLGTDDESIVNFNVLLGSGNHWP